MYYSFFSFPSSSHAHRKKERNIIKAYVHFLLFKLFCYYFHMSRTLFNRHIIDDVCCSSSPPPSFLSLYPLVLFFFFCEHSTHETNECTQLLMPTFVSLVHNFVFYPILSALPFSYPLHLFVFTLTLSISILVIHFCNV